MQRHSIQSKPTPGDPRRMDWVQFADLPDDRVFDGTITALRFRDGFGIHTLNATARRAYETSATRLPGVVVHCFLQGVTQARLAGRSMNLGRQTGQPVKMVLTSTREPEPFWRRSEPDEYVRKVNILLTHDWLAENALRLPQPDASTAGHPQRFEWTAGGREIATMETLARLTGFADPLARLGAESAALDLVAGCFSRFSDASEQTALSPREYRQLRRMEDLAHAPGQMPNLQDLARAGQTSQSTMRRLFQTAHGCSALAYVRQVRLGMARDALENNRVSVAEAAHLAGYGSPENFATAFRRAFGLSPSGARDVFRPVQ